MKPAQHRRGDWTRSLLHLGLLRCASVLVPSSQRADWWREWRGELWHVRQACAPPQVDISSNSVGASANFSRGAGHRNAAITSFCLGAFRDALCVRQAGREGASSPAPKQGTPTRCLLILAVLLAASYALALLLPGVRAERSLWQRTANPNLVLIREQYSVDGSLPSVSHALFKTWAGRRQKYFDGFAFYNVAREPAGPPALNSGIQLRGKWSVAHASSNLFMLLGLPILIADQVGQAGGQMPEVILSEKAWKRDFGADPHVAGATMQLARQMVRIAGVAPDGSLELPGNVDVWMLEPDAGKLPESAGFVIAHLTPAGVAEMWAACVHIAVNEPENAEDDLLGVSLKEWKPRTQSLFLFALFLALVSLPAISSVSLGEHSLNSEETSWSRRIIGRLFFAVKVALLLPVVYFTSLDLAFGSTAVDREQAVYIQIIATFAMSLFGLRWVLKDQRQRCPVCLCRVAHPAQVGLASRTFLDWNGTEMMCMGGHTLLHVPSLPTSWFGSQRWLYLDTSWSFLFASSAPPIP